MKEGAPVAIVCVCGLSKRGEKDFNDLGSFHTTGQKNELAKPWAQSGQMGFNNRWSNWHKCLWHKLIGLGVNKVFCGTSCTQHLAWSYLTGADGTTNSTLIVISGRSRLIG